MSSPQRLCATALQRLDGRVVKPAYDRARTGIGQVHLGVGAFMRAHTAVHTDEALDVRGGDWAIAGVSLRRPTVRDRLAPQDCLYTVATRAGDRADYRLVGAVRSIDVAPENPARVVDLLADPRVAVITLTVTEKGYSIAPDSGRLDTANPDVAHDLATPGSPKSTLGFLAAGLERRRAAGAPPVTIVSCDNLPGNGARLECALGEFVDRADAGLWSWIGKHVRFPQTMVDRIVPATTDADVDAAAAVIGVRDEGLVKTEPFRQWVIEDDFAGERPPWEAAGALLVDDVEPYESAKLRLLNGAHSTLAYLGYLAGYEYVHEVMQNDEFAAFVRRLMREEIAPVTPEPKGMEHDAYIDALLERFANAALEHRTWQIAMDGSQKLPQRLLNTVRARLQGNASIDGLSLAIAGWLRYALGRDERGRPIDVRDPFADRFAAVARDSADDPEAIVARFAAMPEVFGDDLPREERFTSSLAARLRELLERGAAAAVAKRAHGGRRP